MITQQKEKDILKKIKKGDNESFGELYDIYVTRVYRFVRLKVDSQENAQDLTSEAFLRVWKYVQERRIRQSFQALLYRIARNLIIDFYRNRAIREITVEDELEEFSNIEDERRTDDLVLKKEEVKEVKNALVQIKSNYQDVIVWYYIDELSISEIAEILNKKEGTVRVLIHRAVRSLRETMNHT